jgi:hypothetical protein
MTHNIVSDSVLARGNLLTNFVVFDRCNSQNSRLLEDPLAQSNSQLGISTLNRPKKELN